MMHLFSRKPALIIAGLLLATTALVAEEPTPTSNPKVLVEAGQGLFLQKCAFCHGRDAGGGETGPDLTRSALVAADVEGSKIAPVVRGGRPDKGMPPFNLSDHDIAAIAAFIHAEKKAADSKQGGRRGVDPSDLQTGNVEAGQKYFEGAGGCNACHSPTGDLAHVASRFVGLRLEMRMLYPEGSHAKATVTLPSGQTIAGKLVYRDEWHVAVVDDSGSYHSWPLSDVRLKVDDPAEAHAKLLAQYTDDDIHNLMAYLQTLR